MTHIRVTPIAHICVMAVKPNLTHNCVMAEDAHFRLRLPLQLHEALRLSAQENGKSINAEIVGRLERSFVEGAVAKETADRIVAQILERVEFTAASGSES